MSYGFDSYRTAAGGSRTGLAVVAGASSPRGRDMARDRGRRRVPPAAVAQSGGHTGRRTGRHAGGRDSYADIVKVVGAGRRHDSDRRTARVSPTSSQPATKTCSAGSSAISSVGDQHAASASAAAAARPRLGRHRQQRRLHPDQQPRRRQRRQTSRSISTDGRTFKAKLIGTDKPSDLALLKIDGDQPAAAGARQLRRGPGGRRRARGRQSARRRPDGDDGHHQREGTVDRRAATAATKTSCRPTRRSTTATRAARW